MAGYSHVTLAEFRSGVLARLGDPTAVFWSLPEITTYINETLRTWQFFSGFWQHKGLFLAVGNQVWYEIPLLLKDENQDLLIPYSVTDRELVVALEYALLEPATTDWTLPWLATSGRTDQFSYELLTQQVQQALDNFLQDTGLVVKVEELPVPAGSDHIDLGQDYFETIRCAWIEYVDPLVKTWSPMRASDYQNAQSYLDLLTPATPTSYENFLSPQPGLYLYPTNNDVGALEIVSIKAGSRISPTTAPLSLQIPADLSWMVKYAALDNLLDSDGQTRDEPRAEYCRARYEDALKIARKYGSLLSAEVNGIPARIAPITSKDAYSPGWQNTTGEPDQILTAGWNLIALSPVPGESASNPQGNYDVTLWVMRNAPVVSADDDTIDLPDSLLAMIEDFVCHLALFKTAGKEWQKSWSAYETLLKEAMDYNEYLKAQARNLSISKQRGTEVETSSYPRRDTDLLTKEAA